MSDLNEQLPSIVKLDGLRSRAVKLKAEGMESVGAIRDNSFAASTRDADQRGVRSDPASALWQGSGGPIEAALLVRVQNKYSVAHQPLVDRIEGIDLRADLLSTEASDIPVILAARAMQTLIASPGHTLSRTTLFCYYRIIRELYVADSPDWNAGGARAGASGDVSAYVTGECVRAVLMLARSINKTASFFRRTAEFRAHVERLMSPQIRAEWKKVECERAALEWYVSVENRATHLALKVSPLRLDDHQRFDLDVIRSHLKNLGQELVEGFRSAAAEFGEAYSSIEATRPRDIADYSEEEQRSASAHLLAMTVIRAARDNAERAALLCGTPDEALANLPALADQFEKIAREVRRVLDPARRYIASVLDHELTAASHARPLWDPRELAFAAGAYGALTEWDSDERLVRAARLLITGLAEDGMFPRGRPFHSMPNGLRWHTIQFEVCRVLSELLQHVDVAVAPELVEQLLTPFERLRPQITDAGAKPVHGWHMEDPPIPRRPTLWVSALAVLALDKVVRMLDRKINKMVFEHFSVKQPVKNGRGQRLDTLLYPDHGRRFTAVRPDSSVHDPDEENSWQEPVSITLQRMRAHVLRAHLPGAYRQDRHLFSGVFFGPPGTGKTTLLAALAESCEVPLVEISPSDIAKSGEVGLEAHARAAFRALSVLSRVVIIFDEFEPVLWRRNSGPAPQGLDFYKFITPGMLPKLADLHAAAQQRHFVYGLMTNHLENIDQAAIRPGRFDHHVGVYMPDPVSRDGRLMLELLKELWQEHTPGGEVPTLDSAQLDRFHEIVRRSGGASPARLAAKWFGRLTPGSRKWYVLHGGDGEPPRSELPRPQPAEGREEELRLWNWEQELRKHPRLYDEILDKPEPFVSGARG